jgi:predicted nucleotidyltransferase
VFEFARPRLYVETLLGRRVDLVARDALRPAVRAQILSEVV